MPRNLSTRDSLELLSYVMNQNPILTETLELPSQGDSPAEYGKLILANERYKNAFVNTVNLIALTLVSNLTFVIFN